MLKVVAVVIEVVLALEVVIGDEVEYVADYSSEMCSANRPIG